MLSYKHKRKIIMTKSKLLYLPIGILSIATLCSGYMLAGASVSADSQTVSAAVTVLDACSMEGQDYSYINTVTAGTTTTTESDATKSSLSVTCNDANGFSIYAVGSSPATAGGEPAEGNTGLIGTSGVIATGNYTASPTNSYWAMKMTVDNSTVSAGSTVTNNFTNYSAVPSTYSEVVRVGGATAGNSTAEMRSDYLVYMASNQAAGTYTGGVRYVMTHPGGTAPSSGN